MQQMDSRAWSSICFLIILIAFAWIAFAYVSGAECERMLVHPVVPILLIALLLGFRGDDSVRRVVNIAIILICIWIFARLQSVFMPFVIGFSLAYMVNVALSCLQNMPIILPKIKKFYLPKGAAVAVLVILLIGIMAFFALGIVPELISQTGEMQQGIVSFYNKVKDYSVKVMEDWEEGKYPFKDRLPVSWRPAIETAMVKITLYVQEKIPDLGARAWEILTGILARLSSGLIGTVGQISTGFFIFIIFVYAVGPFQAHMESLKNLLPENYREQITRYASEIDANMRGFLRGQLTVIIILSVISAVVYTILRVPFALLVGLLAGLCNAIPNIGPILGGAIAILACLVGLVAGSIGPTGFLIQLALVVGVVIGIQLLDNSLISPRIMSHAVEVHPLVVIFAVLLAANLIGIWGAVLAIPGIVVFKAVIKVSGEIRAENEIRKAGIELES
jgi:predicted PurR-regulated permease PerM